MRHHRVTLCAGASWLLLSCSTSPERTPTSSQPTSAPSPEEQAPSAVLSSAPETQERPGPRPRISDKLRRGLWLWEFDKRGPSAQRSAELAEAWGVYRVFIKGSNGNAGERWWKNASAENIERFASRNIEPWVFGYFYAPDVADADGHKWGTLEEQVASILKVALAPSVRGVVVDAEEEFKDKPQHAEALCKLLRAKLGGRALAYTSYGWLGRQTKFPFKTFDRFCGDAFLPQVYYAFGWPGDVAGSFDRLERDLRAFGLKAPIWPVQSNEKDPSTDRMRSFFDRAGPDASVFYLHPEGSPQNARLSELTFSELDEESGVPPIPTLPPGSGGKVRR